MFRSYKKKKKKEEHKKRRREAKDIVKKLSNYFEDKCIDGREPETNLENIIEEINLNGILRRDFRFHIIMENIKEYESGESSMQAEDIRLDLCEYIRLI